MARYGRYAVLGGALALFFVAAFIFPPPQPDPTRMGDPPNATAWLGRSPYGHCMGHLLLYATAWAAIQAVWAAALTLLIATPIGVLAACFAERFVDRVQAAVSRLLDSVGVFIVGMCVVAVLPRTSWWILGGILAFTAWPSMATVIRTETLGQLRTDYVEAARAIGVGAGRLFVVHIAPVIWIRIQPLFMGVIAAFVAVFAALAFLGAGVASELAVGSLLYDSINYLRSAPWYFLGSFGALCALLVLVVTAGRW